MKVFAGFLRKYYQSFFGFLSRTVSPFFGNFTELEICTEDNLYQQTKKCNCFKEESNEYFVKCYKKDDTQRNGLALIAKKNNREFQSDPKHIHIFQISWELEESFNGSLTHSQLISNSFNDKNNNSSFKSKISSLLESEYPSLNDVLRDEIEEYSEDIEEFFNNHLQQHPQLAPKL